MTDENTIEPVMKNAKIYAKKKIDKPADRDRFFEAVKTKAEDLRTSGATIEIKSKQQHQDIDR